MIPIDKSDSLNKYYRINSKKHISIWIKLLRFIARYLIPTAIIVSVMVFGDLFIFNKANYETSMDMIQFVFSIIGLAFVATILSYLWFKLITINQDAS